MAFVPTPLVVMAEMRFIQDGQRVENTLFFRMVGGITLGAMQNLANDLRDWYRVYLKPLHSDNVQLSEVYITDLTSATAPTFSLAGASTDVGAITTEPMPNSVTLAVSFRTAGRGRTSRGRNYVLGLTESQVQGNIVLSAVVSAYETAYDSLIGMGSTAGYVWVVVSKFVNGAPRTQGLSQTVTSVLITDSTVDNQRRRLPGRGT